MSNKTKQQTKNMKKTLLLALVLGLASASPIMAADLYITGSTAFRANVFDACSKLFDTTPTTNTPATVVFGTSATGGNAPQSPYDKNYQWTMTGTVSNKVANMGQTPLTIHALFTGSVSGAQTTEASSPLIFLDINGNPVTNAATISFCDVATASTPYNTGNTANFLEQKVAVQPFVFCRGNNTATLNTNILNVSNISSEQLVYLLAIGKVPLSSWTGNTNDLTNFVYLINRTQDSGTRISALREVNDIYNSTVTVYNYDFTNALFYQPTNLTPSGSGVGSSIYGVIGPAGNGNANTNWGPGYVGGGDIAKELAYVTNNMAVSYLSLSDSEGIVSGNNWSQVISFNGVWPTKAGAGIRGETVATGTNDYSPVLYGNYPFWNYEVVIFPQTIGNVSGQNLTSTQLGDGDDGSTTLGQADTNSILGVLNYQTKIHGGAPLVGSIENELDLSKTNLATAIPLVDMHATRTTVGGKITP